MQLIRPREWSTSTAGNTVVGTLTDIDVEVWRLQ